MAARVALGVLLAAMLPAVDSHAQKQTPTRGLPIENFLAWPRVAAADPFELPPMTEKRVGFALGPEARGRRVIVAIRAFRNAPQAGGYGQNLAFDVNGEIMGLNIAERPRLLNRPMRFFFDAKRKREQPSGIPGRLGLIENTGSARWTLPVTPSIDTWLRSPDYQPIDLIDPAWIVLDITDLLHPDSFNYLMVKNEGGTGSLRCEELSVHFERSEAEAIQMVYAELREKYFGRQALVRESTVGKEWVYDMDLIDNSHGASGSMAEIQNLEDARRIIAPLRADGYTAVIVSGLHMRYTYTEYWESRILPYMKFLGQAAREAGMKVIDHYDVPIFYSRGYPFLLRDDHLEWTQRDIRYGTPTRMYCINNPDFRKHFFDFTRRVQRECGIDGYQIDEVYFFDKSFCGCGHCRARFEEETGFSLPREADSPVFFNDASPLWRLFMLWRNASMQRFKRDFLASIRRENPAAILSAYTTSHYSPSRRGGAWGSFMVSYANGKEGVTRLPMHDYRYALADFRIYTGVADALGHAPWMLWYPLTSSAARFCWALSQASGCAQWHSKTWSSAVRDLIKWPHKMKKFDFTTFADVGVIFSEKSKDTSMWTGAYHGMESLGWGEAMIEHNIQYHILHEVAVTADLLSRYRLVILPQMTVVDRDNREALETYVRGGGTLLVTGQSGMVDDQGRPRPDFLLGDMMNLRYVEPVNAPFEVVDGDRSFAYDPDLMLYHYGARMLNVEIRDPARSRIPVRFRKDGETYPGVVKAAYGRGTVYTVATFLGVSNFTLGLHEGRKAIFKTNPASAPFMARLIRRILGNRETITLAELPRGIVYTTWINRHDENEINVHFLNVADSRPLRPDETGKRRALEFPRVESEMTLVLRGRPASRAIFQAPDLPEPVDCRLERTPAGSRIVVPPGSMTMYGLLRILGTAEEGGE